MATNTVLDLLLTARYVGGPAFREMSADIDALVAKADGFTRLGAAFNLVGDAMIGMGVAAAAGLGMATDYALNYQDAINRIVAVTPDLKTHTQELAQLNQQVQQNAVKYAQDPTSIAQGAYYLFSSLGVLNQPASALLDNNIIGDLAAYARASGPVGQGGVSFGDAAQLLPRIFAAANAPIGQWGGDLGVLTFLENRAHMTQAQLANSLTAFLPMVTALGMSVPDAATLMTAIASSGRVGAPAGREEMSALTLMLSGSTQQKELASLGLNNADFFDKSTGNLISPDAMIAIIASKLAPLSKPEQLIAEKNLFGQVGMRAMTPLLSGLDKYTNLVTEEKQLGIYNNPQGAQTYMYNVAGQMMNSPKMQLTKLGEAFKVLAIQIGTVVIPPLMQFAHWLTQVVLSISSFVQQHPELARTVALGSVPTLLGGGVGMKGIGALLPLIGEHRAGKAQAVEDHQNALNDFWNAIAGKNATYDRASQADEVARAARARSSLNALEQEYKGEAGRLRGNIAAQLAKNYDEQANYPLAEQIFNPRDFAAERRAMRAQYKQELGMYRQNYRQSTENLLGDLHKPFQLEGELMPLKPQEDVGVLKRLYGLGAAAPGKIVGADWEGILHSGFGLNAPIAAMADTVTHPIESFKKLGSVVKDLATGGFGLLKSAILGLPELIGGIVAVGLPLIAILLVIGGAIAIGVLAFTRYHTQTEALIKVFVNALKPAIELVVEAFRLLIERAKDIWEKMAPQIDAAMAKLFPALQKLAPLLQFIGEVIGGVIVIILGVIAGLINGFLTALPPIIGFFTQLVNIITSVFSLITDLIHGNWAAAWQDFLHIFGSAFAAVGDLLKGVWDFISGFVTGIIGFFQNLFDVLVGHSIIPDLITAIVNWFLQLPERIPSIIISLLNGIETDFLNLVNAAFQWGVNFLQMLGNGITSAIGDVMSPVMNLANKIASVLSFHSPPPAGPLASSDTWMPNMMTMMGNGVTNNTGAVMGPINNLTTQINNAFQNTVTQVGQTGQQLTQQLQTQINNIVAQQEQQINAQLQQVKNAYAPQPTTTTPGAPGQPVNTGSAQQQAQQAINTYYAQQGLYSPYNLPEGEGGPKGENPSDLYGTGHYQQYLAAYGATQAAYQQGLITDWKATLAKFTSIQGDAQNTQLQNYMAYLNQLEQKQKMSNSARKMVQDAANAGYLTDQNAAMNAWKTAYSQYCQNNLSLFQQYLEQQETKTVTGYQKEQTLANQEYTTVDGMSKGHFAKLAAQQQAAAQAAQQAQITDYQKQQTIDQNDFTKVEGMTKQHFLNLQTQANAAAAPMAQAGLNVVTGFVNGILNNLFKVDNAGQQLAGKIEGAVTSHLGIHSPSTLFHEFGHMSVEGYRQGVLQHSPRLSSLWGDFAPLGGGRGNGGALRLDSLHVDTLHAEGLEGQSAQTQPDQERMPAWTMQYARGIQAQRERANAYDTHLDDFDINYRKAYQYQA